MAYDSKHFPLRPAWLEIDLGKLRRNLQLIRQELPPGVRLLAVVDTWAPGHLRRMSLGRHLFALASRKEGLPYVILEAMAAGLPVVATTASGIEILTEPGVNGIVAPTDNVPAIAQALDQLLASADLRTAFGQASQKRVGRFTIDAMVERTLSCYRSRFRPDEL